MRPNFYNDDVESFKKYHSEHSLKECAEHYGVSVRRIQAEAYKLSFAHKKANRPKRLRKRDASGERMEMIWELYQNHSLYAIADLMQCTAECVSIYIRKYKQTHNIK